MLTVTEPAAAALAQKLAEEPDEVVIRLSIKGNRVIPTKDVLYSDDVTFSYRGKIVLVLDEKAAKLLWDKTLDLTDSDDNPALELT